MYPIASSSRASDIRKIDIFVLHIPIPVGGSSKNAHRGDPPVCRTPSGFIKGRRLAFVRKWLNF